MDRNELALAVAGALVLAVLLGWALSSVAARLNARGEGGLARTRDLAARLEAAEAARRTAEARLAEVETDLRARLAEAEADLAAASVEMERARREAEEVQAAYRAAIETRGG